MTTLAHRCMKYARTAAVSFACITLSATAQAQTTTIGVSGLTTFDGSFGKYSDGGTFATFAQTFVAPAAAPYLQRFSIFLSDDFGQGTDLKFTAHVFEFDIINYRLVSTPLFSSIVQNGSSNVGANPLKPFDTYSFSNASNALNLGLAANKTYAIVLTALGTTAATFANLPDGASNSIEATGAGVNQYLGGRAVRSTATGTLSGLSVNGAFEDAIAGDLAFTADFTGTVVPEPSTIVLVCSGLALLIMFRKRQQV